MAGWDREPVKAAYAPVLWLITNTPLGGPLEAYLRLWGVRLPSRTRREADRPVPPVAVWVTS
jgi:hypothetical protein